MDYRIEEKKKEKMDPYGLTRKTMSGEEISQVTPYDGFLLEDVLRIISAGEGIDKMKVDTGSRVDPETGLYEVTLGDSGTDYYYFATMYNRMTNTDYSKKVYRSISLFDSLLRGIRVDYTEAARKAASDESFRLQDDAHIQL